MCSSRKLLWLSLLFVSSVCSQAFASATDHISYGKAGLRPIPEEHESAPSHTDYWMLLAAKDKETIRSRREYFKSLTEEEKDKLKHAKEIYQDLPSEKKQKLREEWEKKSPEEKAKFRKWKENRE